MALVHGGPAGGQTIPDRFAANFVFNANRPQSPYYSQDHLYELRADGDIYWVAVASGQLGTHGPKGWADLQRAINRRLPAALHRSQALRVATRRKIARKRRVG